MECKGMHTALFYLEDRIKTDLIYDECNRFLIGNMVA